ncbi:MAG: hypothetical protein O3B31_02680 [Chloroflexi bacterium]|nr:hypothetical protein [Chloroflexota bacterium]MDA1002246.1 hypothetical protein [Chloroflexota bacterium]
MSNLHGTPKSSARRLVGISVNGLLWRFNHRIEFPAEWDFLILHGPNGVGKTRLLELLHAVFSGRPDRLTRIPFVDATLTFNDGSWISVANQRDDIELSDEHRSPHLSSLRHSDERSQIIWDGRGSNGEILAEDHVSSTEIGPEARHLFRRISSDLPVEQIGPELWVDIRTREELGILRQTY